MARRRAHRLALRALFAAIFGLGTAAAEEPKAAEPPVGPEQSLGAISVGHPHDGFLVNGVRMPKDPRWVVTYAPHAYGTEETIAGIEHCVQRVRDQFPATGPVMLGSISPKGGGYAPPHKSHRSGRDADVYFFRQPGAKWVKAATEADLDKPRTWALLKCFVSETDVDMVLIDRVPQKWLEDYALSIGENPAWINEIFHGVGKYPYPVIKHVPGHVAHMHVRFVSPVARQRGVDAYERLVDQGHLDLPGKAIVHEVVKGDTLLALAAQFKTKVADIQKLNGLESTVIKVGQKLKIKERVDLRAALDPIVIPSRHPPPKPRQSAAVAAAKAVAAPVVQAVATASSGKTKAQ